MAAASTLCMNAPVFVELDPDSIERVVWAASCADDEHGLRPCFALAAELATTHPGVPLALVALPESQWTAIAESLVARAEEVMPGSADDALGDWRRFGPRGDDRI